MAGVNKGNTAAITLRAKLMAERAEAASVSGPPRISVPLTEAGDGEFLTKCITFCEVRVRGEVREIDARICQRAVSGQRRRRRRKEI
jgi:hypothetical protein